MNYARVAAAASGESRPLGKEVVLPEQAGAPVADYEAAAEKWKEEKGTMRREDQEEKDCGTEH